MFRERALIVRAGLIAGPHDPTGRFTYWAHRLERGGEILAPGPPERRAQFIDVRDLGEWIVDCVERRVGGRLQRDERRSRLGRAARGREVTWVSDELPREHEVGEWMELPLWLGDPGSAGMHRRDVGRAVAAGSVPAGRGDARGRAHGAPPSTASA